MTTERLWWSGDVDDYSFFCVRVRPLIRQYEDCAAQKRWNEAKSIAGELAVIAVALEVIARTSRDEAPTKVVMVDREPLESPDD